VWDVVLWRQPARAFALRFDGRVVAYLNRCSHVPTELDWQPGEFLDMDRRWILCAMHGASTSRPTALRRRPLRPRQADGRVRVEEDGQVYWYPSRDIGPWSFDDPGRGASADPPNTEPPTP
jgi:nitrite reductase/ring-hydroxylating ferredoxin subunit